MNVLTFFFIKIAIFFFGIKLFLNFDVFFLAHLTSAQDELL